MEKITTSIAKKVEVDLFNHDDIPWVQRYRNKTTNAPYDLTDWKFEFFLYEKEKIIRSYSIDAGALTSTYISKSGADLNIMDARLMWVDIRSKSTVGVQTKLIQVVTDDIGRKYVYIEHTVNDRRH